MTLQQHETFCRLPSPGYRNGNEPRGANDRVEPMRTPPGMFATAWFWPGTDKRTHAAGGCERRSAAADRQLRAKAADTTRTWPPEP